MQYLRAYKFIFDNPRWGNNLLFAALCVLSTAIIPLVGMLVLYGYLFVALEAMHRRRSDQGYPDFATDRFMDYLLRGLWPFLVQLVVQLPFTFLLMIAYFILMMLAGVVGGGKVGIIFVMLELLLLVMALALGYVLSIFLTPLQLRAGLTQDFRAAFSMEFLKDFMRRVGKEVALAQAFLLATSILLTLIGFMFCCVGMYPAIAFFTFAQFHLWYQEYELYLERGGTPIPLKESAVPDTGFAPEEDAGPEPRPHRPDATIMEAKGASEAYGIREPLAPDAKTAPFSAPPPPPAPEDLPPTLPPP